VLVLVTRLVTVSDAELASNFLFDLARLLPDDVDLDPNISCRVCRCFGSDRTGMSCAVCRLLSDVDTQ
jgi:hypothetical protein